MSIKPIDLLGFAKELFESSNDEVALRDCISKSYYCSYHIVKSAVPELPNYSGGVHQTLIDFLKTPPPEIKCPDVIKLYRRLSYSLKAQKDMRVKADYFLSDKVDREQAKNAIRAAERMLEICAQVNDSAAA
ncbi:HEPN domain-containing protein [Vibrio parahaemolyticus]|uniref:HEPN domain-containing protein n=1 Tax=Vibrio parahaemolyticus TaxID=670 RepID=UPI0003C7B958|nr:HEPN domain-containing protein [Vibrio parahaemolyticus]MBE4174494.1 HEPN domain-containing protein [Vibrio parahaemolyticus]MBE4490311.1 HEPN domain-containing protein [Vibrio parahaemolyticus]MBE4502443.1 HEPN domain-containing protein [Vibrio parahaemolyticus]MBE4503836.1 HEPN domain-containing protein [Vibrio parahaemolyticus]MBE4527486.1 HEPN domain-containing protein [Vibrio parahaemolyticus]